MHQLTLKHSFSAREVYCSPYAGNETESLSS